MPTSGRGAIAIVADDLTGAADTAAGMLSAGLPTFVTWTDPYVVGSSFPGGCVIAIDAMTRGASATDAMSATSKVVTMLRDAGVAALYKKVDSTLRGHPGEEISAALDAWQPGSIAVVAPAFPATSRTTVDGRQRVHGSPQSSPPLAELLDRCGVRTASATLRDVREGRIASLLAAPPGAGATALVCDAETDVDLELIAAAGMSLRRPVAWAGSGGLARALARHFASAAPSPIPRGYLPVTGPLLIVCGSTNEIARAQIAELVTAGAVQVDFPASALLAASGSVVAAIAGNVDAELRQARDVVVTIEPNAAEAPNPAIVNALARLLQPCVDAAGGLIATGGETASALVRVCGITALQVIAEIEPGMPLTVVTAPRPMPVVLKAGGFGGASSLQAARSALRRRHREFRQPSGQVNS